MKILVTGGSGSVGKAAVKRLVADGHDVKVIGRSADVKLSGAAYAQCDINDPAALATVMRGMDSVVHLAAVANPALAPGPEIFASNCSGTFNVFTAAASAGVRRVVQASSINALGYNFGVKDMAIRYFPVDEKHPPGATDPYSFSKQVMEQIGDYFWRRDGISSVSLRLPFVYDVDGNRYTNLEQLQQTMKIITRVHQDFIALPADERARKSRDLAATWLTIRSGRQFERPFPQQVFHQHPDAQLMVQRSNFWAMVDARDAALSILRGLVADYAGAHPLFINDPENNVGIPSRELAAAFFPEVTDLRPCLQGTEALVSIAAARELIQYQPGHSYRELLS